MQRIRKVADKHNLGYHLDGARLWNALIAKGESPKQYGELFDTISVCLSKGLGCPMGSVLIGDNELMQNAIRIRKIFGGGMRQVGYMAAAGLYALENHIDRLTEDHKKAIEIGETLSELSLIKKVEPLETNIIIFELNDRVGENDFIEKLNANNIFIIGMGSNKLRMVTHIDYTDEMHNKLITTLRNI